MNQLRIIQESTGKIVASSRGTETVVWNRCPYLVTSMVGTNNPTNEKDKSYKKTAQAIIRRGQDCATKVGALCARFVDIVDPVKTHVKNGLNKIFDLQGQSIDVSDQDLFVLTHESLHEKEGRKTTIGDPLSEGQRQTHRLLSFITEQGLVR